MIDKNVLNKLILEGKTVKECSLLLGVSPTTIKRYRKEYGLSNNIILRKYKCERCENIVEISSIKEKDKVYCSRSCANTRTHSKDTKDKIKYTLRSKNIRVNKYCIGCNFDITDRKKKNKFCSISCSSKYYANTPEGKAHFQKIGKISASNTVKRSKNEILFFEKCSDYFKNVENNIPIFNGWDADIIIHDIKVAVL